MDSLVQKRLGRIYDGPWPSLTKTLLMLSAPLLPRYCLKIQLEFDLEQKRRVLFGSHSQLQLNSHSQLQLRSNLPLNSYSQSQLKSLFRSKLDSALE